MQQSLDFRIESVTRLTRNDCLGGRSSQAGPAGCARPICLDIFDAPDGILNGAVTGATTEIALQHTRQVLAILLTEACRRHNHACGAETALETLRFYEGALHRVQYPVARQALNRGHLVAFSAKGWDETTMHRNAIKPHRARPAIASVAALFDPEPAHLAEKSAQALARPWVFRDRSTVHVIAHTCPLLESSRWISAAKYNVMCLRYAGDPCTSSRYRESGMSCSSLARSSPTSGSCGNVNRSGRTVDAETVNMKAPSRGQSVPTSSVAERPICVSDMRRKEVRLRSAETGTSIRRSRSPGCKIFW